MKRGDLLSRWLFKSIVMFMVALVFSAPYTYAVLPDKTLIYCSEASPRGFDPSQSTAPVEYTASAFSVHNRLIEFVRGTLNLEPGLATHWDISPDGLRYTFYLRRGAKFHTTPFFTPTREFNADDVLFTFERMRDPTHPFFRAYSVSFPYFVSLGFDKEIVKIEKLDQYTVRFILKSVNAPFLMNLGLGFASILSAEYAEQLLRSGKAADINQQPIGTGPFVFTDYTKDVSIRFNGNPDYWKAGEVQISKLFFLITPDPAVRMKKLQNSECHVMSYPNLDELDSIRVDPNLRLLSQSGLNLGYLAYNVSHKPLDNVLVRHALDMAIDKEAIIRIAFQGTAQIAKMPIPPMLWRHNEFPRNGSYDLQKAKALLTQAGYPNGFKLALWANPLQKSRMVTAEMIQADWSKIGVKAEIVSYDWGEYIKRARAGEHDVVLISWGGTPDLDDWLGVLLTCDGINSNNYSKWCNQPFDELIRKARETMDPIQRETLYKEALQIFIRELPFTPVSHATVYQAINKEVTNFKVNLLTAVLFMGVGLK